MVEKELESSKMTVVEKRDTARMEQITKWFRFEYPERLNRINRYTYLGLQPPETRYALEMEAYNKENEIRQLQGLEPLPKTKFTDLL